MSINIRPIKIIFDTNIPGKQMIPFTKSLLYNPVLKNIGDLNEYPNFTMDVLFPFSYLNTLSYEKQVYFFFNKSEMLNVLKIYNPIKKKGEGKEKGNEKKLDDNPKNDDEQDYLTIETKNGNKNVLIMLQLLFPTKYPIVGNIFSSFNSIILKHPNFKITLNDFLPTFLKNQIQENASYSYVKIDGKTYTISQVIWLNDIYNHKEYSQLIKKFMDFNNWKKIELKKLNEEINIKLKSFISKYSNCFTDKDITYIKNQKKNIYTEKEKRIVDIFIESINDFQKTIEAFILLNDNDNNYNNKKKTFYEALSDNATNMVEIYKSLIKTFFKTKEKYNKIIENITEELKNIIIKEDIKEKYMSKDGIINLNYKNDDNKYLSILKSKYSEYTNFVDIISKFKSPNKESSNYYIQSTINDFLENKDKENIFNYLFDPYNIHKNKFDDEKYKNIKDNTELTEISEKKKKYHLRKNTGVTILPSKNENEPGYEIYVQLNVIGGELNDTNISRIDCSYQTDSLGNRLEYLINERLHNPWNINSTRLYIDIETKINKEKEKDKDKKKDDNDNDKDRLQGGNENIKYNLSYTRKLRENIIKTRKNHFLK